MPTLWHFPASRSRSERWLIWVLLSPKIFLKHLDAAKPEESRMAVIYRASSEVGSAVITAVATTVVSFLPVFTMEAAEGKLTGSRWHTPRRSRWCSVFVALTLIPPSHNCCSPGTFAGKT
ncbi:MAG: efflux RND transporter permease subunit [Calditrichia bacterium]